MNAFPNLATLDIQKSSSNTFTPRHIRIQGKHVLRRLTPIVRKLQIASGDSVKKQGAELFRLASCPSTANAGSMFTHFDPEGNASVLADNSALSLVIPAEQNVHLYASFDSAWEQAVVLYINGER